MLSTTTPGNHIIRRAIVGAWKHEHPKYGELISIIRTTNNPDTFIETTGNNSTLITLRNNKLNIRYFSHHQGILEGNNIQWQNQRNGKQSTWQRLNWITGSENLRGVFFGTSSLINVTESRGKIIGIRSSKEFVILTSDGNIFNTKNIVIKIPQDLHKPIGGYSSICKRM